MDTDRPRSTLKLACAGAALILLGVGLGLRLGGNKGAGEALESAQRRELETEARRAEELSLPDPALDVRAPSVPVREEDQEVAEEDAPDPAPKTRVGNWLANHYGERWEEVRGLIREDRLRLLDIEVTEEWLPPPWNEIEGELHELMSQEFRGWENSLRVDAKKWPAELDAEFLASEFNLDPSRIDRPKVIEAQLASEALSQELEDDFALLMRAAIQEGERKWHAKDYYTYPLVMYSIRTGGPPKPPAFLVASVNHRAWIVSLVLREGEHPEVEDLLRRVKVLEKKRFSAVYRILNR